MAIKLLALDLDDTFLDKNKQASRENYGAITRAQDAGVRVIVVSGRTNDSIRPFREKLGIHDYTIAIGGAEVFDPEGKLIFSECLSPEDTYDIMQWADTRGIHYQVYPGDGIHYKKFNKFADFYEVSCAVKGIEDDSLPDNKNISSSKLLFVDTPENILKYQKEAAKDFPHLRVVTSQAEYLEFLNPAASKGKALKWLAEKLGIPRGEICAIGDSEIDVSMLEYAGLGIAVDNAVEPCRQAADVITAAAHEDGVAKAIDKYILEEVYS